MNRTKYDKEIFNQLIKEALKAPFSGWDFSYINLYGGNPEDPLPWSYVCAVREYLIDSTFLLDMGTGGGEFLSSLKPLPRHTYATEAYKPNIPIAKKTLEPLGVTVVEIENGEQENAPLPFEDNFFDLVINRHECYETKEVYRILKPGGVFVNQQVGYRNNETLRLIFASTELGKDFLWNLKTAANHLKTTTFKILKAMEHIGYNRFYDIRSFIYLLKVLPWEFPDFSIERYENQLFNVYVKLINEGFLDSTNHRFFIIAQKTE